MSLRLLIVVLVAFFLRTSCPAQTQIQSVAGQSPFDGFGLAVALLNDIDIDGYPDFAVAAPEKNLGTLSNVGEVAVYSGLTGNVIATLTGQTAFEYFGASIANVGDVDGDGVDDLIVGAPGAQQNGVSVGGAFVFSGLTLAMVYALNGNAFNDKFGASVDGIGDLNGDGRAEFVIGAHQYSPPTPFLPSSSPPGYVVVYSGATGTLLMSFGGDAPDDAFGAVVRGAGDLNSDGVPDLVVGARQHRSIFPGLIAPTPNGYVRTFSLANGTPLYTLTADGAGDDFGFSIGVLRDADGDGVPDFAIGSPQRDAAGLTNSGTLRLHSGGTGLRLFTINGSFAFGQLGRAACDAGDQDSDGLSDIACSAPFADSPLAVVGAGALSILDGSDGTLISTYWGSNTNEGLGLSLDSFGGVSRLEVIGSLGGAGFLPGTAQLMDIGPTLGPAAAGNVPNGLGGVENSLTINNSDGWAYRRIDINKFDPITLRVEQPTVNYAPARFILWGYATVPPPAAQFSFGVIGSMTFTPYHLAVGTPGLFTIANSFGPDPFGVVVPIAFPAPWSVTMNSGLPISAIVTVQGMIEISPVPSIASLRFTNAILLEVH